MTGGVKTFFNGTNLSKLCLVSDVRRPSPEFRVETTDVQGMDGSGFDRLTVGARQVSFSLWAEGRTARERQSAARALLKALAVRAPARLMFADERDPSGAQLVRYAVPDGTFDFEEFARSGKMECSFSMPDPYLYGRARSVTFAGSMQVDAGGSAPSWPVFTVTPNKGQLLVSAGVGQSAATFSAPDGCTGGQTVVFDMGAQAVRTSQAGRGLVKGSRFPSVSGRCTLKAAGSKSARVDWTERWL